MNQDCGEEMYGNYSNDDPIALNLFAASLQNLAHSREQSLRTPDVDASEPVHLSGHVADSDDSMGRAGPALSQSGAASAGSSQPSTPIQSGPIGSGVGSNASSSTHIGTGGSSVVTAPLVAGEKAFFELCVNTGLYNVNLGEINLKDVSTDAELFSRIYQEYKGIRGHRIRRTFVRPANIHFVLVSTLV
jgi:hypothetical protein